METTFGAKTKRIIDICQGLDDGVGITSIDLALELNIAVNRASAWLDQLVKRGVLVRTGTQRLDGHGGKGGAVTFTVFRFATPLEAAA